ncbi:3-dehydroquinate synthase [Enterococcus timonensis]|uniref:3-dehydroquinate synthase n=1 Tax=Enterococcus timonensis TaxID=1852364 RepID=UPI0008DA47EB|nr:3-dehydroquinate synthase [Enterococcus timonensis]
MEIKTSQKNYPVYLEDHPLKHFKKGSMDKILLVTDENVGKIYLAPIKDYFQTQGLEVTTFVIHPGEASKSLIGAEKMYHVLLGEHFTKSDGIVALGGGVVGDLSGFVASTYLRGLPFYNIPTSLLAQVDASIGGKTAVNLAEGKNLVGTFYQPEAVFIDPYYLETLPELRMAEGFSEIIKMAAGFDADFFAQLNHFLKENWEDERLEIIEKALTIKQHAIEGDVFDNGQRLKLNFGHTLGHALEKNSEFTYSHGEAVALGMVAITKESERRGLTKAGTTQQLIAILEKFNLPTTWPEVDMEEIMDTLRFDKKGRGDTIQLVILKEIGIAEIFPVSFDAFSMWF